MTALANRTDKRNGHVKGEPMRFIRGHSLKQPRKRSPVEIIDGGKICLGPCGRWHPLESYAKQKTGLGGRTSRCLPCRKIQNKVKSFDELHEQKLRAYGLTRDQYVLMWLSQNGTCAICELPETSTSNGKIRLLSVDHCHISGSVRGLLCNNCNTGIGRLQDDPVIIAKALKYLSNQQKGGEDDAGLKYLNGPYKS